MHERERIIIHRVRRLKAAGRWERWLELANAWAQCQRRHGFVVDGLGVWLWPYASLEHLPSRGWEIGLDNGCVVGAVLGKRRPANSAVIRFLSITGVLPPDGGDNLQSTGIATPQTPGATAAV